MRKVPCSNCGGVADKGSSRVLGKLLFHFCITCWSGKRMACEVFMNRAAAPVARKAVA